MADRSGDNLVVETQSISQIMATHHSYLYSVFGEKCFFRNVCRAEKVHHSFSVMSHERKIAIIQTLIYVREGE